MIFCVNYMTQLDTVGQLIIDPSTEASTKCSRKPSQVRSLAASPLAFAAPLLVREAPKESLLADYRNCLEKPICAHKRIIGGQTE